MKNSTITVSATEAAATKPICCSGLMFDGPFGGCASEKVVLATVGVFSIVQIVREVQMLIPAYDFCIPDKECVTTSDNPCELFRKIDFPTGEFFPPRMDCEEGCGCCK